MIYSMPFQVPTDNSTEADSETKSLDKKTKVNFGAKDLRTRSPAYTRDKIRDLEREIKVLKASSTRNDKAKLCKLRYTLSVFNKK
jgi:hypothetical protein